MEVRIGHTYSGFLPPVGLHCRGGVFYQESSYSFFWFSGVMLAAAIVLAVLPWDVPANPGGKLKYWLAGICVWGGICGLAAFFVRNAFLETIIINPQNQTLCIKRRNTKQTIAWSDVIGLQVCRQRIPEDSKDDGYRLNLVWKDSSGNVHQHCLLGHAIRQHVVALGERYESCFGFRVMAESATAQYSGHDVSSPHPH